MKKEGRKDRKKGGEKCVPWARKGTIFLNNTAQSI